MQLLHRKKASGLHRRHLGITTQQPQDAFEVVGEYMLTHLGAHPVKGSGEEVSGTHPGLPCAEGMLNRLAADLHHFWRLIKATLHRLEDRLMFSAANSSLWARRTAFLQRATLTVRASVLRVENLRSPHCR